MENKIKLCINQWAEEDRPREKMMQKGSAVLTDAELLAILIGSGNQEETAVELMRRVLSCCENNLSELGKLSTSDLCRFKGIGPAKAITLQAALELGKRRKREETVKRRQLLCSKDTYEYFHPLMCDLPVEECWTALLNQAGKIIKPFKVSTGGISETVVDIRCILRESLLCHASYILLCHNHPSGEVYPSRQDDLLTARLKKSSELLNIRLNDHVIICDGKYFSYADENRL